jgi:hypothetical protein
VVNAVTNAMPSHSDEQVSKYNEPDAQAGITRVFHQGDHLHRPHLLVIGCKRTPGEAAGLRVSRVTGRTGSPRRDGVAGPKNAV